MKNPLQNIDLRRLSGITTVLGVDRTPGYVRCVVLRRKGNPFNRFAGSFAAVDSFSVAFDEASPQQECSERFRSELEARNIKTRFSVSSLRSAAMKIVTATIPPGVGDLEAWIQERQEKLLRLQVPSNQISFRYEILDHTTEGLLAEIIFVRNTEIDDALSFFTHAGLELIALGAGARDAVNTIITDGQRFPDGSGTLAFASDGALSVVSLRQGKRSPIKTTINPDKISIDALIAGAGGGDITDNTIFAGDGLASAGNRDVEYYTPFGLSSEYTLAAGLAIKGFIPELSPVNYLPAIEIEKRAGSTSKTLFQRTALVLGSLLFVLLVIPFIGSLIVQSKIDALDEEMTSSSALYAEVASLDQRVRELENRLQGGSASLRHTNTARVLHELARRTPDGVWLDHLSINPKIGLPPRLSISGFARSHESIAEYLKNLEESGICTDPKLLRTSSGVQADQRISQGEAGRQKIKFEIASQ